MSLRPSTLLLAAFVGLAIAGTGNAVAGDGRSCGGKGKEQVGAGQPATDAIAARLRHDHLA